MTQYTPSVDLTIFPRINFLKTFIRRAKQRDFNGRIFGSYGPVGINDPDRYPPADGSTCMADLIPFPVDLGPLVTTTPTGLYDLREDCGIHTTYDMEDGSKYDDGDFVGLLPFPIDLGDLTSPIIGVFDLENDGGNPTVYDMDGHGDFVDLLPFPIDLGDLISPQTGLYDLENDGGYPTVYNLNPLN